MISRELKHFHNENRTHVTKKEYSGVEISVGKTPMGKNLLDMDKVVNERQVSSLTSGSQYCAIQLKSNTSYTLTTNCYTDTLASFFLTLPNVVTSTVNNGVYSGATYRTATTDETGILWVWTRVIDDGIPILDTSEFDNGTYWAQLEEGNTATGYEPFIRDAYPVNAPMDLKIYGASYQKVTKQGKNLFDMDKKFDDVIPQLAHATAYQCDKEKLSETEWRFYNFTKGGTKISYFVMPFSTKKNTDYVLSLTVNGLGLSGYIGIDTRTTSNTTADQWNLAVKNWKDIITETETDIRTSFSFNSRDYELLYFRGYFSQGSATDESYCLFKEMQLEEGNTLTDYEPFVPDAPTEEYPSLIYPSKEITLKCTGGDTVNSTKIPLIGNAMEVSDIAQSNLVLDGKYYLSDYIEYNSATDKAYRHKFIDDTLFNTTLPIKDQTQAILAEPTVEEITAGDGEYSFKDAKSVQDGFTLTTESYSKDGLPHPKPMYIEAKIKVIKG